MNPIIPLAKAEQANQKADSVQEQLNQAIAEGDQLAETQQARVDEKGNPHTTLKERLDSEKQETDQKVQSLTTQLAQTPKRDEVRLKAQKLGQTDMTEEFLQQMAGDTPINAVPADRSVTVRKVDFIKGINLFDGSYRSDIYPDMGSLLEPSTDEARTAVVEMEAGKTYRVQTVGTHNRFRISVFNELVIGTEVGLGVLKNDSTSGNEYYEYVNDEGYRYLVIYVSNQAEVPELIVKDSDEPAIDVGDGKRYMLFDEIRPSNLPFLQGYNLFDGHYERFTFSTVGNLLRVNSSDTGRMAVVPIQGGKSYFIQKGLSSRFRISLSSVFPSPDDYLDTILVDDDATQYIVNTTSDDSYLLIHVSSDNVEPKLSVKENDNQELSLAGETLVTKGSVQESRTGIYEFDEQSLYMGDLPQTATELYALFDDLMSEYPEYISKDVLGTNAEGLELISYKFGLPSILSHDRTSGSAEVEPRLKVGIMAGIHGDEKNPPWATYRFFKELCENPYGIDYFDKMKGNIDFYLVPLGNPTGYNNGWRSNGNGVNINRNFTTGWVEVGEQIHGYSNWSGPSPASEPETQLIESWMEDHDFDYYIDFHNGGDTVTYDFTWFVSIGDSSKEMNTKYTKTISTLSSVWARRYELVPKDRILGYILLNSNNSATSRVHANSLGIKSCTLETSWRHEELDGGTLLGFYSYVIAIELFVNFLHEVCKDRF